MIPYLWYLHVKSWFVKNVFLMISNIKEEYFLMETTSQQKSFSLTMGFCVFTPGYCDDTKGKAFIEPYSTLFPGA